MLDRIGLVAVSAYDRSVTFYVVAVSAYDRSITFYVAVRRDRKGELGVAAVPVHGAGAATWRALDLGAD
jgi:hypothetical protein